MAYLVLCGIDKDTPEPIDSRQQDVVPKQTPALLPPTRAAEPSLPLPEPEPTVVAIEQRSIRHPVALTHPAILRDRETVARQLQKELKRVGCYTGHLNGKWSTSTRRAMGEFTNRANAKLPTDQPDIILLALVQAQPNKVCGAPCPAGQGFSRTGRCLPMTILALPGGAKFAAPPNESPASADRLAIPIEGVSEIIGAKTEWCYDFQAGRWLPQREIKHVAREQRDCN
jgi:hypothetical protein